MISNYDLAEVTGLVLIIVGVVGFAFTIFWAISHDIGSDE